MTVRKILITIIYVAKCMFNLFCTGYAIILVTSKELGI
jgi:hypothetical protein